MRAVMAMLAAVILAGAAAGCEKTIKDVRGDGSKEIVASK